MIVFISGGARSGKSALAEELALSYYQETNPSGASENPMYIATSKRSDKEMEERIERHRQERVDVWNTVEEPYELLPVLQKAQTGDVVLIDCLTIWLSNMVFGKSCDLAEIKALIAEMIVLARKKKLALFLVSNDINEGIPHPSDAVNRYVYTLQQVHQQVVSEADKAIEVNAGIPVYWKG